MTDIRCNDLLDPLFPWELSFPEQQLANLAL